MLKKEKQQKYFEKRCGVIVACINNFCISKNPEELHKLRVEIKKIKALAELAQNCTKEQHLEKDVHALKKIFRHAALIRNAHLTIKFIAQHKIINARFKKEQSAVFETQSALFCSAINKYLALVKKLKKTLPKNLSVIKNDILLKEYKKQFKKLTKHFQSRLPEKEMHTSRKKIKRLLYTYKVLNNPVKKKFNLNEAYLNKMQTIIGKWHDIIMEINLLQTHAIKNVQLKNEMEKQKEKYARLIQATSKNFGTEALKVK